MRIREQATRYAIAVEGGKLNIVDIEAAYLLVTAKANAIQYDAAGTPTNAEALLKDLIKNKPYLIKPRGRAGEGSARGAVFPAGWARAQAGVRASTRAPSSATGAGGWTRELARARASERSGVSQISARASGPTPSG